MCRSPQCKACSNTWIEVFRLVSDTLTRRLFATWRQQEANSCNTDVARIQQASVAQILEEITSIHSTSNIYPSNHPSIQHISIHTYIPSSIIIHPISIHPISIIHPITNTKWVRQKRKHLYFCWTNIKADKSSLNSWLDRWKQTQSGWQFFFQTFRNNPEQKLPLNHKTCFIILQS